MNANFENQIVKAKELLETKGTEELRNPHALIGKTCGCFDCFCCAAWVVYEDNTKVTRNVIKNRQKYP